ncbi:hypothetical protein [Bradyrhizobium sp.]|uniref:hypothetical protein n=1 Tax=Bradyrhizobium sp. TaxID=376 RepID=UPI002719D177|nr:hypothetical protein [Bradyrhizobium sp.]MDO9296601.1 hypothetical protein [Bradyrhizobium sp.]
MRNFYFGAICAAWALTSAVPISAAGVQECDKALVISTYDSIASDRLDYRLAESVDEETYKKIKEKHGGGISVPIYGVPVGADYNQFKDNVRRYTLNQRRSESLNRDQALSVKWTGLDQIASSAYRQCLNTVLAMSPGKVTIAAVYATNTDVSFVVRYTKAGGQPDPIAMKWTTNLRTIDGSPLPNTLSSGADKYIVFRQPAVSQQIAFNSDAGGGVIPVAALPRRVPRPPCAAKAGPYNFDGTNCGDNYEISGRRALIRFGSGRQTSIPENNPQYDASIGKWLPGDFNGDGLTDLAHVARPIGRIHIHFAEVGGNFRSPTTLEIRQLIPGYDANLGNWDVSFDSSTGRAFLIHDPSLPDKRNHIWKSNGDGGFTMATTTK